MRVFVCQYSQRRRDQIDAALDFFWLDRVENAPSEESLERHLREEEEFVSEIGGNATDNS
jgi:hypothetical protein